MSADQKSPDDRARTTGPTSKLKEVAAREGPSAGERGVGLLWLPGPVETPPRRPSSSHILPILSRSSTLWHPVRPAEARLAATRRDNGKLGLALTLACLLGRPRPFLPSASEATPGTPSRSSSRRVSAAASIAAPKAKAAPAPKKARVSTAGAFKASAAAVAPSDELLEVEAGESSTPAVSAKDAVNGLAQAAGLKRKRPIGRPRQSIAKAQKERLNQVPKPPCERLQSRPTAALAVPHADDELVHRFPAR